MPVSERVQQRYWAAVEALAARLEEDYYVLALIVYGSLVRGEAWERSDIDAMIVLRDGVKNAQSHCWLTEDGISIATEVIARNDLKRMTEGELQGSIVDSVYRQCKVVFSKDPSIAAWLGSRSEMGGRDQPLQLLKSLSPLMWMLDKAEKWAYVKDDLDYSFMWIMHVVNQLARIEVVWQGDVPGREALDQALVYNPEFFGNVYTGLIHGSKDEAAIRGALDRINAYLSERASQLTAPILDYLIEAGGVRTVGDMDADLHKKVGRIDLLGVCEWLARQGIIQKTAAPIRLTRKSTVEMFEPAYFCEADLPDDLL